MKTCHVLKSRRVSTRKQPKPGSDPDNPAEPEAKDKVNKKKSQKQDLAENLKKNRLVRSFPDEVSSIKILLK